jgi:membrane protein required for colicin V production
VRVNQVDALLLVLLTPFALRGYWRGLCREVFGLAGLLGGAAVAGIWSLALAGVLIGRGLVAPAAARPVAFAALFVVTVLVGRLLGAVADRTVRALLLGGVNRVAGAAFGCAKGAAVAALLLLVAQRLLPTPEVNALIGRSTLGRPLVRIAEGLLQAGRASGAPGRAV